MPPNNSRGVIGKHGDRRAPGLISQDQNRTAALPIGIVVRRDKFVNKTGEQEPDKRRKCPSSRSGTRRYTVMGRFPVISSPAVKSEPERQRMTGLGQKWAESGAHGAPAGEEKAVVKIGFQKVLVQKLLGKLRRDRMEPRGSALRA